jgi:predicted nucleic acid-binding protein
MSQNLAHLWTVILFRLCYNRRQAMNDFIYAEEFVQKMQYAEVVPLDTKLSFCAVNINRKHKLAMADSIIYATAKQYDAILWTTDKHFEGLPNVRYFNKTQG